MDIAARGLHVHDCGDGGGTTVRMCTTLSRSLSPRMNRQVNEMSRVEF